MNIYLTFDVDYTSYLTEESIDELSPLQDFFVKLFERTQIHSTWFIRIDKQIESLFGSPEFIIEKHKNFWNYLKNNGHQLGWHHHAYDWQSGNWAQNCDETKILPQLETYGRMALEQDLTISRMGWGYHTNATYRVIDKLGFLLDSSAIPRPNYPWDLSLKNWEGTNQEIYFPSKLDYRVPGRDHYGTLQVPITTCKLELSTDSQPGVMRTLNPAYKTKFFVDGISSIETPYAILVTHPYELLSCRKTSELLSFDFSVFANNIEYLVKRNFQFGVLTDFLKKPENKK